MEWVAIPSPGDLSDPGIKPESLALQADSLSSEPPGKPTLCLQAQSLQSCLTLCEPMDCSPPGSSVYGRTGLGCHASSRGSSRFRDQTHDSYVSCIGRQVLYHKHHLYKHYFDLFPFYVELPFLSFFSSLSERIIGVIKQGNKTDLRTISQINTVK